MSLHESKMNDFKPRLEKATIYGIIDEVSKIRFRHNFSTVVKNNISSCHFAHYLLKDVVCLLLSGVNNTDGSSQTTS